MKMKHFALLLALLPGFDCSAEETFSALCLFTQDGTIRTSVPANIVLGETRTDQVELSTTSFVTYRLQTFRDSNTGQPALELVAAFKDRKPNGEIALVNAGFAFSPTGAREGEEIRARIDLIHPRIADALSTTAKDLSFNQVRDSLKLDEAEGTKFVALCSLKKAK